MSSPAQPEADVYREFFANLERQLAALSHSDEAALAIESAIAERFKKTAQRQVAFAQPNIICMEPIAYSDTVASGAVSADEDQFTILQGDIVSTEAGYLMGERLVGGPMFAVLNSTCDLVPGRREYASLLRVVPVTGEGDALKAMLHHLLSFRSRRDLYLPPLPNEDVPTFGIRNPFRRRRADPNGGSAAGEAALFAVARRLAHLRLVRAGSDLQGG